MNIVWMALTQGSSGNLDKFTSFLEILNGRTSAVTHTGTDTTDQLEDGIFKCSLVSNTAFTPSGTSFFAPSWK